MAAVGVKGLNIRGGTNRDD